jgi:hypothetical protein
MAQITDDGRDPGNMLATILARFGRPREGPWDLLIGVEATIITVLSVYLIRGLNVREAGLFAVMLASAAMIPKFNTILAINRERIWAEQGSGRRANAKSIISGLSVFVGMFLGFLVVGILTNDTTLEEHFQFILQEAQIDADIVLSPERFSLGPSIFVHNLMVMIAFAALAFLYRSLGTMIALGWNASVWAITLVLFFGSGSQMDVHPVTYALLVIVAIIPHLLLEAAAYITGSLSAIFLSRGVTRYKVSDPRLKRVLVAVLVLASLSVGLLAVGAVLEHYYAPAILELI